MRASRRAAALLAALFAASCGRAAPGDDGADLVRQTAAARAQKDMQFRNAADSPVPPGRRDELLPLAYFPPDPGYSVAAVLKRAGPADVIDMPTSTGQMRAMQRVGTLEFTLKERPMTLGAFVEAGSQDVTHLFVPFTDLTSGTETYPAGRYLDLDRTATGLYIVDFNRAYHPFCYYNPSFDCPFPPAENRLPIPVHAGEKMKTAPRTAS